MGFFQKVIVKDKRNNGDQNAFGLEGRLLDSSFYFEGDDSSVFRLKNGDYYLGQWVAHFPSWNFGMLRNVQRLDLPFQIPLEIQLYLADTRVKIIGEYLFSDLKIEDKLWEGALPFKLKSPIPIFLAESIPDPALKDNPSMHYCFNPRLKIQDQGRGKTKEEALVDFKEILFQIIVQGLVAQRNGVSLPLSLFSLTDYVGITIPSKIPLFLDNYDPTLPHYGEKISKEEKTIQILGYISPFPITLIERVSVMGGYTRISIHFKEGKVYYETNNKPNLSIDQCFEDFSRFLFFQHRDLSNLGSRRTEEQGQKLKLLDNYRSGEIGKIIALKRK